MKPPGRPPGRNGGSETFPRVEGYPELEVTVDYVGVRQQIVPA